MTAQNQPHPSDVDPGAAFAYLREWAAQFHDDASPAGVTDVLVVFAFVAGVSLAAASPGFAAAFLCRLEKDVPSASQRARLLAEGMMESVTAAAVQDEHTC